MTKRTVLLGMVLASFIMAGCGAHVRAYGYVSAPPPPPRMEAYGVAPGPGVVWIDGYWRWVGREYVWTPGRWVRPPRRGAVWESGYWEHRHDQHRWHEGRWR